MVGHTDEETNDANPTERIRLMSSEDTDRAVAKRQIARLIGGSDQAFYVISEEGLIVFLNDAMSNLIGRETDSLIGLDCAAQIPADNITDAALRTWLALPPGIAKNQFAILPDRVPSAVTSPGEVFDPDKDIALIRCIIPLETHPSGSTLVALIANPPSTTGHSEFELLDDRAISIQQSLLNFRVQFPSIDSLWFMCGSSAYVQRSMAQTQIAMKLAHSFRIIGRVGSARETLAHAIHHHRQSCFPSYPKNIVAIECRLMDHSLLDSMLDVVRDSHRSNAPPAILLAGLDELPLDAVDVLERFFREYPNTVSVITSQCAVLSNLFPGRPEWDMLCAQFDTQTIELTPLEHRTQDIPILISAWLDQFAKTNANHNRFRWENSFMDALLAYSWPNDIAELGKTMEYVISNAEGTTLTEQMLPVSVRTYASHVEERRIDTSIDLDAVLEDFEKSVIMKAIEMYPKNRAAAAKALNISRARLLRRLNQWGVQSEPDSTANTDDSPIFTEVPNDSINEG